MTPVSFAEALVAVLEFLFDRAWFDSQCRKGSQHPAVSQWVLCHKVIANGGRMALNDSEAIHNLLSTLLGNLAVIQATNGDVQGLYVGAIAEVGSKAFERRVKTIGRNGGQFLDLMLEISCLAWHRSLGHKIDAIDPEGMADFRLEVPSFKLPVIAECKRVSHGAGTTRFKRVIEKANKQIKSLGTGCFGIVYLDVSERVKIGRTGDEVPFEIAEICSTIGMVLSRYYRSVSGVVVLWKQRFIAPMKDGSEGVAGCLIYRSTIIRHAAPRYELPNGVDDLLISYTGLTKVLPISHLTT